MAILIICGIGPATSQDMSTSTPENIKESSHLEYQRRRQNARWSALDLFRKVYIRLSGYG